MMKRLRLARVRLVVAAFYAATMLAFGFAHSPLPVSVSPAPANAALAWLAAALPDGAAAPFCGKTDDGSGSGKAQGDCGCAACHLVAAPGLAPAPDFALAPPARVGRASQPFAALAAVSQFAARPNSRGPPTA